MPGDHGVDVVEHAIAHHVHLARTALLGRRADHAQRALHVVRLHPLLERDRGGDARGAEQMMSAAVPGGSGADRLSLGHGVLREAGQRVELTEYAR